MNLINDNIVLKCYLIRFRSPRFSLAGSQTLKAASGVVCFSLGLICSNLHLFGDEELQELSQSDVKVQNEKIQNERGKKMDSYNTHFLVQIRWY